MKLQLRLPGGTLKIKTRRTLREIERTNLACRKIGPLYFVWWSKAAERFMGRRGG